MKVITPARKVWLMAGSKPLLTQRPASQHAAGSLAASCQGTVDSQLALWHLPTCEKSVSVAVPGQSGSGLSSPLCFQLQPAADAEEKSLRNKGYAWELSCGRASLCPAAEQLICSHTYTPGLF